MFSILPDLSPRDCHSLWYSSSRKPNHLPPYLDPAVNPLENGTQQQQHALGTSPSARNRTAHASTIERSALGRLRADEIHAERRRHNVGNLGSTWLKPPGVSKTLFQMREERREADEHAEAVRREQLHQELAEAAGGPDLDGVLIEVGPVAGAGQDEDFMMGEEDAAMGRDLDEEIPDADDDAGFGYDGTIGEDDEDDGEDGEDEEEEEEDNEASSRPSGRETANRLATARATEDRMREMVARASEGNDGGALYGEEEELTEQDQANLLEEEDLVHETQLEAQGDMDLDMDADLDADIPEAGFAGGYEHTDSDASVSADEGARPNASHVGQYSRYRASLQPSNGVRNSLDISGLLSQDGSSMLGSSPQMRRRG